MGEHAGVHGAKQAIIATSLHTIKESRRESGRGNGEERGKRKKKKERKKEGERNDFEYCQMIRSINTE